MKSFFTLVRDAFNEWSSDKAMQLGAALAYYSVFSIGPLVLLLVGIAGLIFGQHDAQNKVLDEIGRTLGPTLADNLRQMFVSGEKSGAGTASTIVGVVTLLIGATGVFGQLQDSLNTIWKVEPKPGRGIWGIIRDRFLSLTMVVGIGFLLLISLVLSTVLSALTSGFGESFGIQSVMLQVVNQVVTLVVSTLLFAAMYKVLPDAETSWRDVWIGALITSILFCLGKFGLGLYLGREGVTSGYGAAGSLVLLLLWVYYSSLIFLFGAEYTYVHAREVGRGVRPSANAVSIADRIAVAKGQKAPAT